MIYNPEVLRELAKLEYLVTTRTMTYDAVCQARLSQPELLRELKYKCAESAARAITSAALNKRDEFKTSQEVEGIKCRFGVYVFSRDELEQLAEKLFNLGQLDWNSRTINSPVIVFPEQQAGG